MKIVSAAKDGFNEKRPPARALVVALDLTKAFDSLDHPILIEKLAASSLPNAVVRWLANYLHGRQIRTIFKDQASPYRLLKVGSPQGSIISPELFAFYVKDVPMPPPGSPLRLVAYADDITVFGVGDRLVVQQALNAFLPVLRAHLDSLFLRLSPGKSSVTLLTPFNHEISRMDTLVDVRIGGDRVPVQQYPKILGVVFDPLLHFHRHAESVNQRVRRATNVLKALGSAYDGQQKETLLATYKALGRSIADYAAPVWTPIVAKSRAEPIQRAQNAALRVVLGVHVAASEDHLHDESQMLKVTEHWDLLSSQFLASCYDPSHPCCELSRPFNPSLRRVHTSLQIRFGDLVAARRVWDPGGTVVDCAATRCRLHTDAVRAAIGARTVNRVLDVKPPVVSSKEKRLPRRTRSFLSQLRSGFSIRLNSFRSRFLHVADVCPDCGGGSHTTAHLFNCPSRRTVLVPLDLWRRPIQCARFLQQLDATA
jgi:hypothetical protein